MIVYLDESGDLGFDFNLSKTSHYLVMTALVCEHNDAASAIMRAIKKTIKNKIAQDAIEIKGGKSRLSVKKYFLKHIQEQTGWRLYTAIANKKTWLKHHRTNHVHELDKKLLYDEVAEHLLAQIDFSLCDHQLEIIIDRSKNRRDIGLFDHKTLKMLNDKVKTKKLLVLRHLQSFESYGLQAVDLFCWGVFYSFCKTQTV